MFRPDRQREWIAFRPGRLRLRDTKREATLLLPLRAESLTIFAPFKVRFYLFSSTLCYTFVCLRCLFRVIAPRRHFTDECLYTVPRRISRMFLVIVRPNILAKCIFGSTERQRSGTAAMWRSLPLVDVGCEGVAAWQTTRHLVGLSQVVTFPSLNSRNFLTL